MNDAVREPGAPARDAAGQPAAPERTPDAPPPGGPRPETLPSGAPSHPVPSPGGPPPDAPEREAEPCAPAPLGVPRTPTGRAEVDGHLERLADADHLATDGHLEVYEDVHRGLRDALTALDTRPGPPAPPAHGRPAPVVPGAAAPSPTYGNRS